MMTRCVPIRMLALGALLLAGAARGADCWPLGEEFTWVYRGAEGDYEVHGTAELADGRWGRWAVTEAWSEAMGFRVRDDGDIELTDWSTWVSPGLDPDEHFYSPPLLYLDLPLVVGKTWLSVSGSSVLAGEVTGLETVTTPAGSFAVFVVRFLATSPADGIVARELHLAPGIGPVFNRGDPLVSFSGPVGLEPRPWGSLKAQYR